VSSAFARPYYTRTPQRSETRYPPLINCRHAAQVLQAPPLCALCPCGAPGGADHQGQLRKRFTVHPAAMHLAAATPARSHRPPHHRCFPPLRRQHKAKAHVFLDVAMEQVTKPTPEHEVKAGAGTKVVATIGPSVRWRRGRGAVASGGKCRMPPTHPPACARRLPIGGKTADARAAEAAVCICGISQELTRPPRLPPAACPLPPVCTCSARMCPPW
jgi:hypothetical protein